MARVSVDVPDSILEESKLKQLKTAERKVKSLEAKVADLERTHKQAKEIILKWNNLRAVFADVLDLREWDWDD